MRLSIVTATMSLATSAWAGIVIPPPPPGSACLSYPDTYPKPNKPASKRSLGITSLPRLWARNVLTSFREMTTDQTAEGRRTIACACVPVGKKEAVGFYTKAMCPAQKGAYEECSVEFDGYRCVFVHLSMDEINERFTDEKCNAAFPGTTARCGAAYPGYY
ncbi:hypothetical protein QBC34DRAFT_386994 [Podospora aff. communis PSN243]|uniref:Uncharacterized protein n=1 Tax=Podospora aff. communis PSN243 TaxID=3040156 RepID=A0AAV9G1J9_9PEZI|nr:hypothetical protein QBC34DRAFT_386994 [Podospora aff. communis PSN243]